MSNGKEQKYGEFVKDLNDFVRGSRPQTLEKTLDKAWIIQLGEEDFNFDYSGSEDYTKTIANSIRELAILRRKRQERIVNDASTQMTSERDAFYELSTAARLLEEFVIPARVGVESSSNFFNGLVREIYNLSIAYVQSITAAAADEFIDESDVFDAKVDSTKISRFAYQTKLSYKNGKTNFETFKVDFDRFNTFLRSANVNFLRDFKLTQVEPKKISHRDQCIADLARQIPKEFLPGYIVPIANGGIDPAVKLDYEFHKAGHELTNYPIMFSIKTRRQRRPWTDYDREFLDNIQGSNILVVEDWITSGKTLKGVLAELGGYLPLEMRTATIKQDPLSMTDPILQSHWIYTGAVASYLGTKTDNTD